MHNLKLDRRSFINLVAVGIGSIIVGFEYKKKQSNFSYIQGESVTTSSIRVEAQVKELLLSGKTRLDIIELYMGCNKNLTDDEKDIIRKTFTIIDDISEDSFINIVNNLKFLSIKYLDLSKNNDNYRLSYVNRGKVYCYKDEHGDIDEKSLIDSLYILYDLEHAFDEKISVMLANSISKYDIADEFLKLNPHLSGNEKSIIRPICNFLDSYVDDENFMNAVRMLRLLNVNYNCQPENKATMGVYTQGYTLYSFNGLDEQTILHEAFHAINNGYSCLEEGMTNFLTSEYKSIGMYYTTIYEKELVVLKSLCELIGPQAMADIYMNGVDTDGNNYDILNIVPDKPTLKDALLKINGDEELADECVQSIEELIRIVESEHSFSIVLKKQIDKYFEIYFFDKYGYDAYSDIVMAHYLNCQTYLNEFTGEDKYRVNKTYFCEDKMRYDLIIYEDGLISYPLESVTTRNKEIVKSK